MSEASNIPSEWYFITPPQDVSWSKDGKAKTIDTYGTNNPYLNYGSTGLRKLSLSNAMAEGFSDAKQVEDHIRELETCMHMVIDSGSGYAAPYCWEVFAGDKSYGTFIILGVNVKEDMRDMSGKATRAVVDIELQEVSPYQVSSGTDITAQAIQGSLSQEGQRALDLQASSKAAGQDAAVAGAKGTGAGAGSASSAGGAGGTNGTSGTGGANSSSPPASDSPSGASTNTAIPLW